MSHFWTGIFVLAINTKLTKAHWNFVYGKRCLDLIKHMTVQSLLPKENINRLNASASLDSFMHSMYVSIFRRTLHEFIYKFENRQMQKINSENLM